MTGRVIAPAAVLPGVFLCAGTMPRIIVLNDPLTPEEHLDLGFACEQKKEYGMAIKEYGAAAKKLRKANLYLANARFLNNEPDRAEALYRLIIKDDPQCADAYNNLAWLLYMQKRDLSEARELVSKAISLNPSSKNNYTDTLNKIEQEINKTKTDGR